MADQGTYHLSLYLGNGKYDFDIVENALNFEVIWDSLADAVSPPGQ